MRKQLPKIREGQHVYMSRNAVPEYRYINYDLDVIKKEYESVSGTIMEMQMSILSLFRREHKMTNYWKIQSYSLFTASYAFVDHNSYLADQLFIQNKISVRFGKEMARKDSPYCLVFCKVLKRDITQFEEALARLKNKMLLLGHTDYLEACSEIEHIIENERRESR